LEYEEEAAIDWCRVSSFMVSETPTSTRWPLRVLQTALRELKIDAGVGAEDQHADTLKNTLRAIVVLLYAEHELAGLKRMPAEL